MWYKFSQTKGLEEKIIEGSAEQAIRRRLFANGDYNPTPEAIAALTKRVMKQILDKYGNYNLVRHHVKGESLSPAVDEIVSKIIKLGY